MPPDLDPSTDVPETFDVEVVAAGGVAPGAGTIAGTRLPPGLAAAAREIAMSSRRAIDATSNDPFLVRLKPSADTAEGLKNGTLRLLEKGEGGTLATAYDTRAKKIVENIEIERAASATTTNAARAAAGAAFAWQALAIATQQHYLVEIGGSLDAIESAVTELGMDRERESDAFLEALVGKLARIETHIDTAAPVVARDREIVDDGFSACEEVVRRRLKKIDALFADDEGQGKTAGPSTLARQIALTKRALAVMARCAWVATQMPDQDPQRAVNDLRYYADRFDELREQVDAAVMRLSDLAQQADEAWERHRLARKAMTSNVRKLKDPLKSLAGTPVVGDRYVSTRAAVRKLARRPDRDAERAAFDAVSRKDLVAPKAVARLPEEERGILDGWLEALTAQAGIDQIDLFVDGDEVRLLARTPATA